MKAIVVFLMNEKNPSQLLLFDFLLSSSDVASIVVPCLTVESV